jgi:predicted AAA+ superfamily ATPase
MYRRGLAAALEIACQDTPVIFLAGARQTGKSTLVQSLGEEARYLTFDSLPTLAAAQADPEGFVAALGPRVILDEVQRVPELLLPLKAAVDRERRPGRFVLTGSANVLALPKVAESLAGRMEVLTLWPLSQAELEGVTPAFVDACFAARPQHLRFQREDRAGLVARALAGGFPEAVSRKSAAARDRWFEAYQASLLQRDVRDLAAIEGLAQLPLLLRTLATRAGSALNVADLGRTLGMNQMTLKRYLALFELLFLTVPLLPWFENLGKRLAKTPKLYLNDAGLLAHLLGLDAEGLREQPALLGPVLENFAVLELIKTAPWSRARPALFHLRTSTGQEVDVVLESRKRELVGVEIKASATVSEADFKPLKLMRELVGERFKCGVVLYAGKEPLPFGPRLWALPLQALWAEGG